MKIAARCLALFTLTAATVLAQDEVRVPEWAYVEEGPRHPSEDQTDPTPRHVPGTDVALTAAQANDYFEAADWHPNEHPPMPDIIARGRKPGMPGCGYCHQPNGLGRSETASLAGLPVAYVLQQIADYRSGARKGLRPHLIPQGVMASMAIQATDEEVRVAAEYFAGLRLRPWIRVVESDTAPKTRPTRGHMLVTLQEGGVEPLGNRIIETPEDRERTFLRDSQSGYIAYVPKGSLKKGRALVTHAQPAACTVCHGADLRGLGPIPGLAGRSPTYLFRQLYDMKAGVRAGAWSGLMKDSVAGLSEVDMVSISAYIASLAP